MRGTKIIHRADQIHPVLQGPRAACQGPAAAGQRCQAFPEGRVEPFDVGGVDHSVPVRATPKRLDPCWGTLHDAPLDIDNPLLRIALDDLRDADVAPGTQPGTSLGPRTLWRTKCLPNRSDVGDEPIGTAQQGAVDRTAAHPLDELTDQWHVAMFTDPAREPQACLDHHRQRHPYDTPLGLDADLIGLDVPKVPGLLDQLLLHGLALAAGTSLPRRDRPLVIPKGDDDCLQWAAVRQKRQHERHGLGGRPQAVERRPFRRGEGFAALRADESFVLARMDANVAMASLASGRTRRIRQNIVVGSMLVLRVALGNVPRGVWLDPRLLYKFTTPRFSGELPRFLDYLFNEEMPIPVEFHVTI